MTGSGAAVNSTITVDSDSPGLEYFAGMDSLSLIQRLESDRENGLSLKQVEERVAAYGLNEVEARPATTPAEIFLRQFVSSVVVLLLVASGISFLTGDHLQAAAILAAVFINALVGFLTEWRASVSLAALAKIASPSARIRRQGHDQTVPAASLVPGDLVVLEAGSRVPADLRLIEAAGLTMDESVLTGESVSQAKSAERVDGIEDDRLSTIAYHGTHVLDGRGLGLVLRTGARTSLGELQKSLIEGHRQPTPLEKNLDELGGQLTVLTVIVCVLVLGTGMLYKHDFWKMLEAGIALAVAAIPEGLPVVATLALAIGVQRMVKLGTLVRQLSAVETLGCTTIICSDKTGTLTENKLTATDIVAGGTHLKVTGSGYAPVGEIVRDSNPVDSGSDPVLSRLFLSAYLCNDASLEFDEENDCWTIQGDPTEGALLVVASKSGVLDDDTRSHYPRLSELPFCLSRKMMATMHRGEGGRRELYVKGSPEVVLGACSRILTGNGIEGLGPDDRRYYADKNEDLARHGLRVLAFAIKELDEDNDRCQPDMLDEGLVFVGLIAMKDTLREGVSDSMHQCKEAGIRVMMLTGDQLATATSIAEELDLMVDGNKDSVATGAQLGKLESRELTGRLASTSVVARVTPSMKLNIVRALQERGEVVAMTGDGVNDAPALQQADIGVAMGKGGTDLAREASNMVITDDNFTTIVSAIRQGRVIYENIKRSICYLLTAAVASVITVAVAMAFDGTLAMTPLQLLWLNLIMHIFPGLGIVMQEASPGIMSHPPRAPGSPFLGSFEKEQILMRSVVVSAAVLVAIHMSRVVTGGDTFVTTVAFTTIALALLMQAWGWLFLDSRKERVSVNKYMYICMVISYLLTAAAVYLPPLQVVLNTVSLELPCLGIAIGLSLVSYTLCLVYNFLRGKRA